MEHEVKRVRLNLIRINARHRSIDPDDIADLAENIKQNDLTYPIQVYYKGDTVFLAAGLRRLEACRLLGHKTIAATIMTRGEAAAEMWEIDENLQRKELTTLERDAHVIARAKLTEKKMAKKRAGEVSRQVDAKPPPHRNTGKGRGNGGGRPAGGTRAAAREMGMSEAKVRRAKEVDGLCEAAKREAERLGLANNHRALVVAAAQSNDALQVRALNTYRQGMERRKERREIERQNVEASVAAAAEGSVVRAVSTYDHESQMARDFWNWVVGEYGDFYPLFSRMRDRDFAKLMAGGQALLDELKAMTPADRALYLQSQAHNNKRTIN